LFLFLLGNPKNQLEQFTKVSKHALFVPDTSWQMHAEKGPIVPLVTTGAVNVKNNFSSPLMHNKRTRLSHTSLK
jgi:hypothetical protein